MTPSNRRFQAHRAPGLAYRVAEALVGLATLGVIVFAFFIWAPA